MGFFKFLKKEKKRNQVLDEVPLPIPPAPALNNLSQDVMPSIHESPSLDLNMPEPPKPFDHGANSQLDLPPGPIYPSQIVPSAPMPQEVQKPIIPNLSELETRVPEIPSFADQFNTHPEPKIKEAVNEKNPTPKLDFKVPELNINSQKEELVKHFDKISSELNISQEKIIPQKKEITNHVDNKIEEHLDNIFSFGSSFAKKKEEPKVKIVKKKFKKEEQIFNEDVDEEEYAGPSHMNLEKPLFLSLNTCENISENLSDIRILLKEKDSIFHALNDIDKKSESHYTHWKGIMESVQTQLFTIDKKLFR